jgi:hypothetical protein
MTDDRTRLYCLHIMKIAVKGQCTCNLILIFNEGF